jgi:integrase
MQTFFNNLKEKDLSGATVSLIRGVLTGCFNKAVTLEMMRRNPLDVIDAPKVEKPEFRAITQEEGKKLIEQARGTEHEAFAVLLLSTGCRPNEGLALKWTDVNFDAGTVKILRNLANIKDGKPIFGKPKTKNSIRTMTLGAEAVRYLRDHRRKQQEARLAAGPE